MTDQQRVEVLPVPEGSIIVLRNVDLGEESDLVSQLEDRIGHDRFLVVCLDADDHLAVWGPDVDLAAKIRDLLGTTT